MRLAVGALLVAGTAGCAPASLQPPKQALVGAYYFAGWWSQPVPSNYLMAPDKTIDWRPQYPEREPVIGWFDDSQATVDQEIALAAGGGLDFFVFDWYAEVGPNNPGAAENVNNGLKYYLTSPNKPRLRFALLYVNHGFSAASGWSQVVATWTALMLDPQYLKIEGRPLLIVYRPDYLRREWGSAEAVRQALDVLRANVQAAGLPPPLVGGGEVFEAGANADTYAADGYDFLTTYALPVNHPAWFPNLATPYDDMIPVQVARWSELAAASPLPYLPSVLSGWDARPVPEGTNYLTGRTPAGFGTLLQRAKDAIDASGTFRLPARDGETGVAIIYAWNELSEGGFIMPTKAEGDAYLRQVPTVFAR